jgi:hypothetical protein
MNTVTAVVSFTLAKFPLADALEQDEQVIREIDAA